MPIAQWAYPESPDEYHIDPIAQDFRSAFGTGGNEMTLATMELSRLAIVSIQTLEARNQELENWVQQLKVPVSPAAAKG